MNEQLLAMMLAAAGDSGRTVNRHDAPMLRPGGMCALGALLLVHGIEALSWDASVELTHQVDRRGLQMLEDLGYDRLFLAGVNDGFENSSMSVSLGWVLPSARETATYQAGQELGEAFAEATLGA